MRIPKSLIQAFSYLVVGAGATVVEWLVFYLFDVKVGLHYSVATALAFAVSTLANWALGRVLVFKKGDTKGLLHELSAIYGVSIVGLLMNIGIMWVVIECFKLSDMMAKIIATMIVFVANFAVRKFWIYKV